MPAVQGRGKLPALYFRPMTLIDVALPLPLFRTFTYRVPDGLSGSVSVGSRVLVPFRKGKEIGVVMGEAEPREGLKYKDVLAAPDDAPVLDAPMLALCRWIAEYYVTPLGVALRCALPAALTANTGLLPRKTIVGASVLPFRAKGRRAPYREGSVPYDVSLSFERKPSPGVT